MASPESRGKSDANAQSAESTPRLNLADISTRWTSIQDPDRFVLRYSSAIVAYLTALLKDADRARDVAQSFYLNFVQNGLPRATPDRGRFRDYLKVAVRNAALSELRKRRPQQVDSEFYSTIPDEQDAAAEADMRRAWATVMVDKLWRALDQHQRQNPGNYAYSVLRVSMDYPQEDSQQQAARVEAQIGSPLNAAAFRKQRSRARALAAQVLLDEVRTTVANPTAAEVEAELAELQLLDLLRDYLTDAH